MIKKKKRSSPKRRKEESSYDPRQLGCVLEREMGDMTRADFARMLGVTRPTLDKYLSAVKGGVAPSCEALCLMADNLGCSVDYLVGRSEIRNPEKAVALDELLITDELSEVLQKMKDADLASYHLLLIIIQQPWFWRLVLGVNSLMLLKYKGEHPMESGTTELEPKFEFRDGRNFIYYTGDEAIKSVIHFAADLFSRGIDELTDDIATSRADPTILSKNYINHIHGKKTPPRQTRSGENKSSET